MDRIDHTVKFYEREDVPYDCRIVAKMDDPPVEGCGKDICDALSDLRHEISRFSEGVHEAFDEAIRNELDADL